MKIFWCLQMEFRLSLSIVWGITELLASYQISENVDFDDTKRSISIF
jgi:hypothetical protein